MTSRAATTPAYGAAGLVVLGAVLIQWSAAIMEPAFRSIGPGAASGWRFVGGAVFLVVLARPRPRSLGREQWLGAVALGVSSSVMNLCFYQAISRIPLGTAVAIEYAGPFLVAALGQRSWRHWFFVAVATVGVIALAHPSTHASTWGLVYAAGSGVGWAAYALTSHRLGGVTNGFGGLAIAMSIGVLVTVGFMVPSFSHVVTTPALLFRVLIVGIMATALGFGAEMQALRRLRPSVVGVLLALDPAVAFLVGLLVLNQSVSSRDLLGLVLVVTAGVGVTVGATTVTLEPAR